MESTTKTLEFPRWLYPKDGTLPFIAETPDKYDDDVHSLTPLAAQAVTAESMEAAADAKEEGDPRTGEANQHPRPRVSRSR